MKEPANNTSFDGFKVIQTLLRTWGKPHVLRCLLWHSLNWIIQTNIRANKALSTLTFDLNLIFLHHFSNGKFYLLLFNFIRINSHFETSDNVFFCIDLGSYESYFWLPNLQLKCMWGPDRFYLSRLPSLCLLYGTFDNAVNLW